MTDDIKNKAVKMEVMQAFVQPLLNKGIVNYATCSTAAATAKKQVTLGTTFALTDGAMLAVKFTYGIAVTNPTLEVKHTPLGGTQTTEQEKAIYYQGGALASGLVKAGDTILLRYNGTQFDVIGGIGGVSSVDYDGTNKKLTVTANGSTSDVVTVATLKTDMELSKSDVGLGSVTNDAQVKRAEMGANSGVATLDSNGKVPSSQLPSYVDDVVEGYYDTTTDRFYEESTFDTVITPVDGKSWVDVASNKSYRWTGSVYVRVDEGVQLGETSDTAYRGDRGKTAYDHSQVTSGNPHNVTKSDVGLGSVGNFKAVSTEANQGLSDTEKGNARANIGAGTSNFSGSYNELSDKPSSLPANGGNANTVNNHTVNSDVPANAVFTDTTYSTMGASGSNHASGLVPDPGAIEGTTKFLCEDGTWKTPDTGSAAAYTPTLVATPTSSTVSYTDPEDNTKQVWFEIGQFARVADAESDTGYVMYQLHDVTVTGAGTAQESHTNAQWMEQTGGGGDVTGKIKVSIAAFVNDVSAASSLLGNVTVSLTNTTDSGTPVTETWNGSDITFSKLTPMKNYRVAIEDKTGWLRDKEYADVTNLGISEERAVSFSYSADEYSCSVSGTADGRIVVSGTEYANGATFRVAKNTSITATAKAVTNYVTPTPSISGKTITATYVAYGYVTVNTASNQGQDATIAAVTPTIKIGDAAAVSYTAPVQVAPGTQVIVTWPAVTGYATPAQQTFTKSGTSNETKTGTYQTEVLTVSITKDTGDGNLATVSIAVTDGNTSLGTLTQASPTLKIPYGVNYTLTPSALDGYATPAAVTKNWADTTAKSVTFQYDEVTMLTGYIILDQTSSDPTTKVIDEGGHTYSNYQRPAVIDAIRAASHCYVGTFANNKMTLKQLDDTDGTKYADGTSAATDIASTDKDVFMRLPFFFTRVSTYATDKIKIEFAFDPNQTVSTTAQPDGSGWKQWGGNDLIGKYEAYEASNKTYSISGKTPTGNVSQANFKSHARARGTGFTIVKWRHQNLMAILFYAYYGHTNCQSLIGSGTSSNDKQTGQKNSLGMTDTTAANGNTNNIVFWGLENWWGNKYEWVDNVVINNHTWTITEDDGSTRTIQSSAMASGNSAWIYASKFILGDDLDVIAAAGQSGGSDSTGYCDGQYYTSDSSRVVLRSGNNAYAGGGVAYVYANSVSSSASTSHGSRLAFSGTIEIS